MQLWTWCQGDLVKAPGQLADGWRWKVWCSGKCWPDQSLRDDGRLHSDMLLQEWLVLNNENVGLLLSCSRPHWLGGKPESHVCIEEAILEVHKVKVTPSEQLHMEKVLAASGAKYPLAHVVTRHFTLAMGQHRQHGCFGHWTNPYQGHHRPSDQWNLHRCLGKEPLQIRTYRTEFRLLVGDGHPLLAQPWQLDFMQGLYAETYHALLNSNGMYPSDWSNGYVEQFMDGSMLLSCDLMPDDSDNVAYLSPRRLGTVKVGLRFATPLPATTTLIAYAQYDNLVVVDAYRTVTFDYNVWCWAGNLRMPSRESHWWLGRWSVSTPMAPAYLINTARCGAAGVHWVGVFLEDSQHAKYFNLYGTTALEFIYQWLQSMDYRDIWYSMKMQQGPLCRSCAFYFLAMWSRGMLMGAIIGAFQEYSFAYNEAQIRRLLRWHTHAYIQGRQPPFVIRPPVYIEGTANASTLFFLAMETPPSSWPHHRDPATLTPGNCVHRAWWLTRGWPLP